VWLDAGKTYRISARGRYQIAAEKDAPWPCEPGGVTIEYHDGRPLGILLGAIYDGPQSAERGANVRQGAFAMPLSIGLGRTVKPEASGTLYLRVNDSAGRLGDNRGRLTIRVED
jgi:hypothetical protein